MKLLIWTKNEGNLDTQFRDGDILFVKPDAHEFGGDELAKFLAVQMPDHPGDWEELVASEYGLGAGGEPEVRKMRKYRVPYAQVVDPDLLAQIKDPSVQVPVIADLFTLEHIVRK